MHSDYLVLPLRVSCLQRLIPRRQLLEHLTAVHRSLHLALVRVEIQRCLVERLLAQFLLVRRQSPIQANAGEVAREACLVTIAVGS